MATASAMKDRLFEIWFSLRLGPANTEFQRLLDRFGTPFDIFNADEAELDTLPLSPRLRAALSDKSLQESSRILEYCADAGVDILFWQDENYPTALRSLKDPPVLLYCYGRLPDFNRLLCISVVGTRTMSEYGKRMAYKIGYELAAAGAVVVSGMALGNDSVAAAGALAAGGTTVAVLGCGIDVLYPKEHERLYAAIADGGVILTELPPGTRPEKQNFPMRNRIISGLSQGTVVVEGDLRSGALITAKTAILQGRDIYAFPGNVGVTNSAGTNRLISEGAAVILRARDVLENYAFLYRNDLDMTRLDTAERVSDVDEDFLLELGVGARCMPEPADTPAASTAEHRRAPVRRSPVERPAPSGLGSASPRRTPASEKKKPATTTPKSASASPHGDASQRALASLSDTQRRIFEALPLDGTVTLDHLAREGFSMSDIMASVTILEIKGLIQTLPVGLLGRK